MKEYYQAEALTCNEQSDNSWNHNRRQWLKLAIAGSVATQIPWMLSSCQTEIEEDETSQEIEGNMFFTQEEMQSLVALQNNLFPDDGNGPSAFEVNAHGYYIWMLQNEFLSKKDQTYFTEKLKDLLAISIEKFGKPYYKLSSTNQIKFIKNNIQSGWTQSFISRMITVIFEATLLDPIYGVNTNEVGWIWLDHLPGQPQPSDSTKYPTNLKTLQLDA